MMRVGQATVAVKTELTILMSWYKVTNRDMNMILLGVSLGLKTQGVSIPDLELALSTEQPNLFLGKGAQLDEQ